LFPHVDLPNKPHTSLCHRFPMSPPYPMLTFTVFALTSVLFIIGATSLYFWRFSVC